MTNSEKAKKLKQNTEIIDTTFEKHNLQVIDFSIRPESEDESDSDFAIVFEICSLDGGSIDGCIQVKANLYDANGNIYAIKDEHIFASSFEGYDSFEIGVWINEKALDIIKAIRVFAKKR